jgi:hypothetical protein
MRRTARRAGIWAVFWLLILQVTALGNKNPVVANVLVAGFFFVVLWGVGWMTESFAYRRWLRRHEGGGS